MNDFPTFKSPWDQEISDSPKNLLTVEWEYKNGITVQFVVEYVDYSIRACRFDVYDDGLVIFRDAFPTSEFDRKLDLVSMRAMKLIRKFGKEV